MKLLIFAPALLLSLYPAHRTVPDEPQAVATQEPPTAVAASELLARVVVVGASVSEGFGLQMDFNGRDVGLNDFVAAALPKESQVLGLGDSWLFLSPLEKTKKAVDKALEFEPTLVIGIDFLFWFAYGLVGDERNRDIRLEKGLEQLARFDCPIVVGDIPDMRAAIEGTSPIGPMLSAEQVPTPAMIGELNTSLRIWAKKQENEITIVPLSDFVRRSLRGEAIELRGNKWTEEEVKDFLQDDLLHPTAEGTGALTALLFDELAKKRSEIEASVSWEAKALEASLR